MTGKQSPNQSGLTRARAFVEGAGLATLYILPIANAFFKPWHVNSYHHAHPVGSIPRAIFFLTLLVWALASIACALVDRLQRRARDISWIALTIFLLWLLGRMGAGILDAHPATVISMMLATHIVIGIAPVGLFALSTLKPAWFEQVIYAVRICLTIAAFGLLVLVPKLAWQGLRFEKPDQTFINPSATPAASAKSRIIWILMDELSYDLLFEHRPTGLSFPNFQEFAQQSTSFSNIQPSGYYTELVIPGLILGRPIADVEHVYGRPFRYRSVVRGPWYPYDPAMTIFGEAHQLGWTTGIAAWFNPYCRFLANVLDSCYWQYSDAYPGFPTPLRYSASTFQNLLALLPPHERFNPFALYTVDRKTHMQDYRDVMEHAEALVRDSRIRFIFLHLPVPHPPGIYDRSRHTLAATGDYIDNLALADETLGELMRVINSTPAASRTTVIVSSDHSWRVEEWKKLSAWTPEEQRVSGGRFDPRPVLMVRLPGATGQVITRPSSALVVHRILDALLRGQIHSQADLIALDNSGRSVQP